MNKSNVVIESKRTTSFIFVKLHIDLAINAVDVTTKIELLVVFNPHQATNDKTSACGIKTNKYFKSVEILKDILSSLLIQCYVIGYAIKYHTIPYHTIPYHTILHHIIPHTIPHYTTYHTTSSTPYLQIIPHHTTSYHTILANQIIPYHTTSHHTYKS